MTCGIVVVDGPQSQTLILMLEYRGRQPCDMIRVAFAPPVCLPRLVLAAFMATVSPVAFYLADPGVLHQVDTVLTLEVRGLGALTLPLSHAVFPGESALRSIEHHHCCCILPSDALHRMQPRLLSSCPSMPMTQGCPHVSTDAHSIWRRPQDECKAVVICSVGKWCDHIRVFQQLLAFLRLADRLPLHQGPPLRMTMPLSR